MCVRHGWLILAYQWKIWYRLNANSIGIIYDASCTLAKNKIRHTWTDIGQHRLRLECAYTRTMRIYVSWTCDIERPSLISVRFCFLFFSIFANVWREGFAMICGQQSQCVKWLISLWIENYANKCWKKCVKVWEYRNVVVITMPLLKWPLKYFGMYARLNKKTYSTKDKI